MNPKESPDPQELSLADSAHRDKTPRGHGTCPRQPRRTSVSFSQNLHFRKQNGPYLNNSEKEHTFECNLQEHWPKWVLHAEISRKTVTEDPTTIVCTQLRHSSSFYCIVGQRRERFRVASP